MAIENFIYDLRYLKYRCVQAYLHTILKDAEEAMKKGITTECTRDTEKVRIAIINIVNIIEEQGNTYNSVELVARSNPMIIPYYNVSKQIVNKYFKPNDEYIPALLTLEVLRLFTEKGYSDFKDIDFVDLQGEFQMVKDRKANKVPLHMKCAEELFNSVMNKKVFKKKRKK